MNARGNVVDFESERRAINATQKVRCAHCSRWIEPKTTRCPFCGIYFDGFAFQFHHDSEPPQRFGRGMKRAAFVVAAMLLLAMFALSYAGFALR